MADQLAELQVNLKWPLEDNLQAVYSNQFAISGAGPEYILTFGEFLLPGGLFQHPQTDIDEYLKNASVKPVAKIVLSHKALEALANMLKGFSSDKAAAE
jgi:hypothetical protein